MKKVLLIVAGVLVLAAIVGGSIYKSRAGVIAVTTAKIQREDLTSIVTGTGQIKPKTYVNIGATAFGRITHLYAKEGDHVKRGQVLATLESVQPTATVASQAANIASVKTDVNSYVAAEKTAEANLAQSRADLQQKKFDIDRYESLYKEKLVAKQDYDSKKAAYDVSAATVQQREAALAQSKAQTDSSRAHVNQQVASQRANFDALDKTISRAPYDGLVTNVPVREGETMVTGIQNAQGSTLMTIADMSVITAEVKVDETDVINVKMDQAVDVTVDALPGRIFHGHVTEVGDQALLRTTGIATSQSTTGTEEAKDFKVVVTLDNVSGQNNDELRPGLSATAKVRTASVSNAVILPLQALVSRDPAAEAVLAKNHGKAPEGDTASAASNTKNAKKEQGVYVVKNENGKLRAYFRPVKTGITGSTDIQVTDGLQAGDEVVTGRYKILRSLASGSSIKRDTTPETAETSS
ncbi:multidrug resistance efflux pump [Terriglobus roseus DSM 18391]|uniref:Multidrug resistance efflux pump n=1 Tax=Terriglobus roseus (strain DSM 18391 / NRRL B-41598 / KBS 63) TaxID=926566 RepID=I3ZFN2_TERRK|nr:efflux RND transporter periplasmic adaptor subunit [Terriglobus roseus]AFL88050.1 multidrug resistance efflux pump [Terriglobus roseus DSM 18391]